jgi:uncharacterized protein YigA (DUF484 family)
MRPRKKLHELINGRANDAISTACIASRAGCCARDAVGVVAALETRCADFGVALVLLTTDRPRHPRSLPNAACASRGSPELKIFGRSSSPTPRSGQIRDTQRDYLFGGEGSQVGSTVLIPLGERAGLGLLAIASHDTERYLPTMSTDYLVRIGEIVTEAVSARLA